jgi:hypothetical protein
MSGLKEILKKESLGGRMEVWKLEMVVVSRCETEVFLLLFFGQKSKQKGLCRWKSIGF